MATKVILPKMGQTMEEGTIVEWLKNEGDVVVKGEPLMQVESDKAVLEAEARVGGVLRKILVGKGSKVRVLSTVGIIGEANEDISALLAEFGGASPASVVPLQAPAPTAVAGAPAPAPSTTTAPQPVAGRERIFSSPRARMVAAEKGVELAYVLGSGPEGRIVEKDVLGYLASQPAATPLARKIAAELGVSLAGVSSEGGRITAAQVKALAAPALVAPPAPAAPLPQAEGELVSMSGVRAIIASRMATSSQTTAAVTLQSVVDATEFVALRTKLKEALAKELGFDVGYNDILAAIVARCLAEYPYMNARLEASGIRRTPFVNVGMAVDSDRGLLVPVIRDANKLSIKALARAFRELVGRAREGKSLPDDLTGGTFTITNLGMFGVDAFTPIINLPECAILGVGRIKAEPAVVDGQVVVRQRMWLSLTFDHRLVDGAPAARFLQAVIRYVEAPYLLLA